MSRRCTDLRVEYLHSPLAVATRAPRFSWLPGLAQTAYRLTVADRTRVIWDSGRVGSTDTALVPYAGPPLASDADHVWTVTSWDADGVAATADSTFGTALLDPADWAAEWVRPQQQPTATERWSLLDWIRGAANDSAPETRLRPPQLLRQVFALDAVPVRARLYATAHGVYQATLNGRPVGDEVLAPGFDSYRHRLSVQCYDVTPLLAAGDNVLGVVLADGWWAGRIGITGSSAQFGDRTAATWQLHVELADGRARVIRADGTVVSSPGPWVYADLFVGERFDAQRTLPGWDLPGFDASDWAPVSVEPVDRSVLVPFAGEPIRRVAELPAVSVHATDEGFVVDFGQVVAGRVQLSLEGQPAGRVVTIEHTETLDAGGGWFRNIRGINKEQTDVYVTGGAGGTETFEPAFTYHGFRYARVSGVDELESADITAVVIASDLEYAGTLTTNDARLNRLHENVVWSQRGNFVSVPTDCPQREKVGWTGDAQVFAPASANNAVVVPFLDRWLANLRADQLADGAVPITSPRSPFDIDAAAHASGVGAIVHAAGWSDAIALVPWTLYERYGDVRMLEENVDAILRWIGFQQREAEAGIPSSLDGVELSPERRARQSLLWNTGDQFGDWLTPSTLVGLPPHEAILVAPRLTGELVGPMFQARTLSVAAHMLDVLDRPVEAAELAARAAAVREAFAVEYVGADGGLPVALQGVHALALAFDMVPDAVRQRTADRLARLVEDNGDRLDTGFLGIPHLLDTLWDSGHRDLARRVLWQSDQPSWLYEVDAGATTIWESWDAIAPDGTPRPVSLNHYAFGCVDDWLYRRVAGIVATAPGYRRALLQPDLESGLTSAAASVWTPYGPLAIDWRLDGPEAIVSCTVPHGIDVELDAGGDRVRLTAGTSTHVVRASLPLAASPA